MKHKDFLIGLLTKLTETDFIPLEKNEVKKVKEIIKFVKEVADEQ